MSLPDDGCGIVEVPVYGIREIEISCDSRAVPGHKDGDKVCPLIVVSGSVVLEVDGLAGCIVKRTRALEESCPAPSAIAFVIDAESVDYMTLSTI